MVGVLQVAATTDYFMIHETSLLMAVRACFHIHLTTKSDQIKTASKTALDLMVSTIVQRMEVAAADLHSGQVVTGLKGSNNGGDQKEAAMQFVTQQHKDAYLAFRAICRLSMKAREEESHSAHRDSIPLMNK